MPLKATQTHLLDSDNWAAITFRLPAPDKHQLRIVAAERGLSISGFLRELLAPFVNDGTDREAKIPETTGKEQA